jgi:branched-chain amino acid transport system substrate-binding protein
MSKPNATRRAVLGGAAAGAAALAFPGILRAQGAPIKLATLTPLTGGGGSYGPVMARAAKVVVDEVNAAGGVLGRQIQLVSEDDQTNPEAGVRAARKLIDVDKVAAILGTWASSVTTAVAPLCWESKTFLCTVSGADSITQLPHQGYLVRTQPTSTLQSRKIAEFFLSLGAKRVFVMAPQTPFTQSMFDGVNAVVKPAGGEVGTLIYDDKKTTYRTEVDQALRFRPDMIFMGGYTPDTTVVLKDMFRAGYKGMLYSMAYSVNQKLVEGNPAEISHGVYTMAPSPDEASTAYARLVKMIGVSNPDPYTCQVYDHANLAILAMAAAKQATGDAIKDAVRRISQGGGRPVDNALDGLKALAAGEKIDYVGASGPCDFTATGDIVDCKFRYERVQNGKITLLRIA